MKVSRNQAQQQQQKRQQAGEEEEEERSPAAEAMDAAAAAVRGEEEEEEAAGCSGKAPEEVAGAEGRTVVVGVRADVESRALLTWVLVNAAAPGDRVVAVHVVVASGAEAAAAVDFDAMLGVYEGFCNLKQVPGSLLCLRSLLCCRATVDPVAVAPGECLANMTSLLAPLSIFFPFLVFLKSRLLISYSSPPFLLTCKDLFFFSPPAKFDSCNSSVFFVAKDAKLRLPIIGFATE
jgi:hypothetical protein